MMIKVISKKFCYWKNIYIYNNKIAIKWTRLLIWRKSNIFTLTPKETTPNRIYDGERRPKKIWKLFLFSNAKQAKFQTEENKIKWQRSWLQELLWMKEAVVDPCFVVVVVFISFICGVHTRVFVPHCQRGHKLRN